MRTRGDNVTGPVPTESPATTRELRPRQAPGVRGSPAGGAVPRAGGRVTRSSGVLAQLDLTNSNDAVPQPPPLGSPRRSHKRSGSSIGSAAQRPKRTRQGRHLPGFYGEESESGDEPDNPYMTPGSDVEQKASSLQPRTTPKKSTPAQATKSPARLTVAKPLASDGTQTVTDAVIPDWASLPYHVLVQIFRDAAAPLTELQHARWLTAASGVCRAFAEPALTALYEAPPLLSRPMAHGLVSLLSKDPSTTLFNYRSKVEELWIDVEQIASKTYKGQPLDLEALVGNVPRLKFVQFFHHKDAAPYRSLDGSLRWHYPADLFQALNGVQDPAEGTKKADPAQLVGWQWNRRLMGPDLDLDGIKALHQTPPFIGLKRLSFVNYQVPSLHAKANADDAELAAQDQAFIQGVADAITVLPAMKHLSIESSTAVNDHLLPLLPKTLETLELINCWDVNADDFASYLLSSGYQLKNLILHHNQSLSLSFLTVLGTACPNLQLFSMDFKTYNHHEFYHDSDPSYDSLLTADQTPDWPVSLETLQLLNMKKWEAGAAETFFQSLVDSAPRLLKLRRIELKAMLSIPIQERSQLRNKWDRKLRQVFLRDKQDPQPLFSLRTRAGTQQQQQQQVEAETAPIPTTPKKARGTPRAAAGPGSASRRSHRIAVQYSNPSSRASSVGRDLRHGLGRPSYAEPDTDEDDGEEEEEEEEDGGDNSGDSQPASPAAPAAAAAVPFFRHGLCEKVEIQLDNQKSAETTLTMDDFLDSEHDDLSDDDWVGEDEDFDTGYAW